MFEVDIKYTRTNDVTRGRVLLLVKLTPERRHLWVGVAFSKVAKVFIINFEHISHHFYCFFC